MTPRKTKSLIEPTPAPAESRPAGSALPLRVAAVIDVGSTAIRMEVAELQADGTARVLDSLQQPVHLGKDTFTKGRILQSTLEECVKILKGYRRVMQEYGVTEASLVRAVATSAVREAANRETFLDRVYMATGINVEAIDEAEETRLTYLSIQNLLPLESSLQKGDALVVEVGGGDTELLLLRDARVSYSNTFRLGTLRMRETLDTQHAPAQRTLATYTRHIQLAVDQIKRSVPVSRTPLLIAPSGDARFAATHLLPDWQQQPAARLEVKNFAAFARKIATTSHDELVRKYRVTYQEAETVGPALLAYAQLAREFGVEQILVPKSSLRQGLLQELASGGLWTKAFTEQVVHSAIALGAKYAFDERHGRQAANLCLQFFHELQPEHMLSPRHELLLHVAGLVHEIGLFVNNRSHHKHSMYLIMNSDLFGLSHHDMLMIAMVARYHRRATPQPYHEGFSTLDRDDRLAVSKMAAILRVADALDRNHMQQVRDLRFTREGGDFVVWVRDVEDLTLERLALKEKGSMFEEIYGLKVVFRTESSSEGIAPDV
jgi:exopolyphosphatase/guanosine-5'-triphosphate,3'-diphosphate pyrophosphatase